MKDTLITPSLVRAARGLINWQQSDLAKHSGLSVTAIKNFEGGQKRTHTRTTLAIQNAFESHGVEFPASGGVRQIEDISTVYRFTGKDFIKKWNEDIFAAIRNSNHEILTASTGEEWWYHPAVRQGNLEFLEWRDRLQVSIKSLIPEGHKTFNLPTKFYRVVPKEMLGKITYCLYADRIAFVLWKKQQIVILRNLHVVQTFRNQFLYLWRLGREIV